MGKDEISKKTAKDIANSLEESRHLISVFGIESKGNSSEIDVAILQALIKSKKSENCDIMEACMFIAFIFFSDSSLVKTVM